AAGRGELREPLHEAVRDEQRILLPVEGADDVLLQHRLERPRLRTVQHLHGGATLAEQAGLLAAVREAFRRGEDRQGARLTEPEVELLLGELAVELEALHAEPPEERHRPPHPPRGTGGAEAPEPARQLEARPRRAVA